MIIIIIFVFIYLIVLFECFLWYVGFVNILFDILVNKRYMNSRGYFSVENKIKKSMFKDFCIFFFFESK